MRFNVGERELWIRAHSRSGKMPVVLPLLGLGAPSEERELWIRAHSGSGKISVVLTLLGLSSSLRCTTKSSNFPLWGEKVVFLASWGGLLICELWIRAHSGSGKIPVVLTLFGAEQLSSVHHKNQQLPPMGGEGSFCGVLGKTTYLQKGCPD